MRVGEEPVDPPEKEIITIKLLATSTPSGATLSMGVNPCPATPCDVEFGQDALDPNGSVSLTFAKAGYKSTTVKLADPNLESNVNAELTELVAEKAAKPSGHKEARHQLEKAKVSMKPKPKPKPKLEPEAKPEPEPKPEPKPKPKPAPTLELDLDDLKDNPY